MGRARHAILAHTAGLGVSCLTAFLLLGCAFGAFADDWPMMRHDAQNTGRSADVVRPPLRLLWRAKLGGVETGALLASGDMLCVAVRPEYGPWQDTVLIDRSGRMLRRLSNALPLSLRSDTLMVARLDADRAEIVCEDARRGTVLWTHRLDDPADHTPGNSPIASLTGGVVSGDLLFISVRLCKQGRDIGRLFALRLANGALVSQRDWTGDQGGIGSPAVDGEHVYGGGGHWLHVLDRTTLKPQWAFWDGGTGYPMIAGNIVVTPGWAHRVQAVDIMNRQQLWGMRAWRDRAHCLAQDRTGGMLAVESTASPQVVVAVEISTGTLRWQHPLFVDGLALSAGRYVLVPGHHKHAPGQKELRGGLYCLDADSGALVWKHELPGVTGRAVAISDGRVYAVIGDELCAFEGRTSGQ